MGAENGETAERQIVYSEFVVKAVVSTRQTFRARILTQMAPDQTGRPGAKDTTLVVRCRTKTKLDTERTHRL